MEHTPRYQLTYPTSSDEVDDAPQQFKTMCESVETALGMVDDRQTADAVKPVVRTTLTQLQSAAAVTGQTGVVTDDPDQLSNGVYHYFDGAWSKVPVVRNIEFDRSGTDTSVDQVDISGYVLERDNGDYLAFVTIRYVNKNVFRTTGWKKYSLARMTEWEATREAIAPCAENIAWDALGKNMFAVSGDTISYQSPGAIDLQANAWHAGNLIFPVTHK